MPQPIEVNRYIVAKGENQSIVLYWYQSQHRVIASEYEAKFWTVTDAIRYNRTDTALLTGKIVKGVLELQRKHVFTQDYVAENKADKDKTLIVEHPFRQGWKLVDTDKPWVVDSAKMAASAGNTPFDGQPVQGRVTGLWKGGVRVGQ